ACKKRVVREAQNIPKLLDELFEMIKVAPQPTTPTVTTTTTRRAAPAPSTTPTTTTATATANELQDIKALCCCLSISSWTTTQPGSE
ncbi:MAG: hypothetical protein ACKPKO_57085, partial [Candidatus Fonsibacter sp.]